MTRRLGQALESVRLYTQLDLRLTAPEPSRSQCLAGADAGKVSPETARRIYLAMLEADEVSAGAPSSR